MPFKFKTVSTALITALILTGCSEALNSTHNTGSEKANAFASCEYFKADWCAPNLAAASTVCEGQIYIGDMIFSGVQTVSGTSASCAEASGAWHDVTPPQGCARAITRSFSDANGSSSQVLECLSEAGQTISLEGSIGPTPIKAIRP